MIEIPEGTRVFGIQLPIQAQSQHVVADWERTAGAAGLARVAQAADDAGFFYVGVCDHIAIPDDDASRRWARFWSGLHRDVVVARGA